MIMFRYKFFSINIISSRNVKVNKYSARFLCKNYNDYSIVFYGNIWYIIIRIIT